MVAFTTYVAWKAPCSQSNSNSLASLYSTNSFDSVLQLQWTLLFATINTKSSEWPINCLLLHQHCLSLFRYKSGDCIGDSQVSTPTWLLTFFVWSQGRSLMSSCLKPGIRLIFHEFHKCCIIFPRCYLMWKPFGVFVDALLHSIFCIVFLYSLQPAFFTTVQKSKSCHTNTSRYAWNKMWFSVFLQICADCVPLYPPGCAWWSSRIP